MICANCGTDLQGPFCHQCGQHHRPRLDALGLLFQEFMGDLWCFDTKVLPTLRQLVMRPGDLTLDYLQGRRVRQVPPFKLFLFLAFLLGLGTLLPPTHGHQPSQAQVTLRVDEQPGPGSWEARLQQRGSTDPEGLARDLRQRVMQSTFVLVPAFAGILALLFRRSGRHYAEHLVFALHLHAFAFLTFLALMLLDLLPWKAPGCAGNLLASVGPAIYLYLALKRVHGESRRRTLAKFGLLALGHGVLLLALVLGSVYLVAVLG